MSTSSIVINRDPWAEVLFSPFIFKIDNSFIQNCSVTKVYIGQVGLENKLNMWNDYNNNDRQQINFEQKSSLEPLVQWTSSSTHWISVITPHSLKTRVSSSALKKKVSKITRNSIIMYVTNPVCVMLVNCLDFIACRMSQPSRDLQFHRVNHRILVCHFLPYLPCSQKLPVAHPCLVFPTQQNKHQTLYSKLTFSTYICFSYTREKAPNMCLQIDFL